MEIKSIKLICYSPTGTTKKVAQSIAKGFGAESLSISDITKPEARERAIEAIEGELLIVAVPVYMGRVPALINDSLKAIKANGNPAVCVVVYGNRTYGNALFELKDIMAGIGCRPVAGGAFIGEHSFSTKELPVAESRPNAKDLEFAEDFGKRIRCKMIPLNSLGEMAETAFPGEYPYGGVTELWSVDFIEISDKCANKGICATVCPTGAITPANPKDIDINKCISCCACIKACPESARTIKDSQVKDAAVRLNTMCGTPKVAEVFL